MTTKHMDQIETIAEEMSAHDEPRRRTPQRSRGSSARYAKRKRRTAPLGCNGRSRHRSVIHTM